MGLAEVLTNTGQYNDALNAIQTYIDQVPDHAGAYAHMGKLLLAMGYKTEARDAYEIALVLDPSQEKARSQLNLLNRLRDRR
jgi:predicted negative regulator of RcsB-dependent stress response